MNDKENFIAVLLFFIVAIGLILLAAFIGSSIREKAMINAYNDGICKKCGGKYEFLQAVDNGIFLYACNNCNNVVELKELRR